jgi:CheY-like chemotaxis protein
MLMSEKTTSQVNGPPVTIASVVLLVENEVVERVLKAVHLRTAGFNVMEAADGEEARRVIDSAPVNIVFADLAMPDQTNGLAFLRWLRKRHPNIKTIITSETDMLVEGYGMFLSKPYRLADLDYCLERVLATARIPASETGGAMTADLSMKANPAPGNAQPGSVHPNGPPASYEADGRDDDVSKPSIADLSRRLAERAARQGPVDPAVAKEARRAALEAYDCTRTRRRRLVLGLAGGAIVCSTIIYLAPTVGSRAGAPPPRAPLPEPALLVSIAVATPIPALPDPTSPSTSPSPATNVAYTSPVRPAAKEAPAAESQQALGEMALNEVPLQRDEAKEVQARLRSFGFNPGLVDGDPGPMTEGAIRQYQQSRRQPQTGKVDRELLEQLRHDPAPKIVQRTAGPYARPTPSPDPRRPSPFESVRVAGDRLGQWLDSKLR